MAQFHLSSLLNATIVKGIGVAGIVAVVSSIFRSSDGDIGNRFLIVGLVVASIGIFFFLVVVLVVVMIATNGRENGELGEKTYVLEPDAFAVETGAERKRYNWSRVTDVGRSGKNIWLHIDSQHFRIIPTRSFSAPNEMEEAWRLIQDYGPAA